MSREFSLPEPSKQEESAELDPGPGKRHDSESWSLSQAVAGMIAALMAGILIGWIGRTFNPPPAEMAAAKQAAQVEKSNLVAAVPEKSANSLPKAPEVKSVPPPIGPDAKPEAKDKKPPDSKNGPKVGPIPKPGDLKGHDPAQPMIGSLPPVTPQVEPAALDLHAAEAKLRVLVMEAEGQVVSAKEATGGGGAVARAFLISVPEDRSPKLSADIRSAFGVAAVITEPDPTDTALTTPTDTKFLDLMQREKDLTNLRKQVDRARLDYYPDAPALKSMEAQYAVELRAVQQLRKRLNPPVSVSVVLSSSS